MPHAFEAGEQYMLNGVGYHILKELSADQILVRNMMTAYEEAYNTKDMHKQWNEGNLEFGLHGPNLRAVEGCPVKTSYEFTDLDFLKNQRHGTQLIQETWDKYQLVCRLIDLTPKERTDAKIEAEIRTYVAEQILLSLSMEPSLKRTSPIFPPRSGKRKKKTVQKNAAESLVSSTHLPVLEGVENTSSVEQLLASAPLLLISARQVRRWIEAYELSRGDIRSLVPAYYKRGMRGVQLPAGVEPLLREAVETVYKTEERLTVKKVIDKLEFLILQKNKTRPDDQPKIVMPNKRKIYRYVYEQDPVEIDIARLGKRAAQRKHAQYGPGPRPTRPNERWELDDTLSDLFVIDDEDGLPIGRPWFFTVRDKKTAVVPGFSISFTPPSAQTAMECLFYAIPEKDHVKELFGLRNDYVGYGIPETLVIDRGSAYLNKDLELACAQLHIELDPLPGRSPWLKAGIERYIEEAGAEIFHASPGTSFSNFLVRGDYDPEKHACITLNGLWYILHKWIVDVYTRDSHRGIGGVPAKLWKRALGKDFVPRLPPSRNELAILLSRMEGRVIQNTGIEFENLWYQDSRLSKLREILKGEPVYFKYNPGDISRIWVMYPGQKRYLEVLAVDQEYTRGLSLWKHSVIKRYVREEMERGIDRESLILAKEELYQLMHQEFRWGKKLGGRKRGARYLDIQVNKILRRAQRTDSWSAESGANSQLIDFEPPTIVSQPSETEVAPDKTQQDSQENLCFTAMQVGVALPAMVDDVTLLVDEETKAAGAPFTVPKERSGEKQATSEGEVIEPPQKKPKVNTDPDELTSYGIAYSYGCGGPT